MVAEMGVKRVRDFRQRATTFGKAINQCCELGLKVGLKSSIKRNIMENRVDIMK